MKLDLTENAKYVLKQRYLMKDEKGEIIETPLEMFKRTAKAIAEVEFKYGKSKRYVRKLEKKFLEMLSSLEFLPNSPTLMNAGTSLGQLSACFVLPIRDHLRSIMEGAMNAALIHQSGGGTGFSFSKIRPKGDLVGSTGGIASGPISFMTVYDTTTNVVKQGGKRRGANMGILRIDHPDILDFIVMKEQEGTLANFNISIAITDKFMKAVKEDSEFDLINPRTGKKNKTIQARALWNLLVTMSWKNGEPGIIFIDTINKFNPTPSKEIEATNPCGEQPLLPYESCNLGSINLSKFVKNKKIDWKKLEEIIRLAVRFLDNVIDVNKYPIKEIKHATLRTRKIGLGVMGFADLLIMLRIKYNSEKAIVLAKKIMKFIRVVGKSKSIKLGKEKGSFPDKDISIYKDEEALRNATVTTIAPTGTISIIAGCSFGIEPIYSLVYKRNVEASLGKALIEITPIMVKILKEHGMWKKDMINYFKDKQCVDCLVGIPKEIREVIISTKEIAPDWHVKMQAAFQSFTDNAVSKTVNLPKTATINHIETIYLNAYSLGCKGITVYRDGSRKYQLLEAIKKKEGIEVPCPVCNLQI